LEFYEFFDDGVVGVKVFIYFFSCSVESRYFLAMLSHISAIRPKLRCGIAIFTGTPEDLGWQERVYL
jgi:hypothetical protein